MTRSGWSGSGWCGYNTTLPKMPFLLTCRILQVALFGLTSSLLSASDSPPLGTGPSDEASPMMRPWTSTTPEEEAGLRGKPSMEVAGGPPTHGDSRERRACGRPLSDAEGRSPWGGARQEPKAGP